jgi:hypothetical protein
MRSTSYAIVAGAILMLCWAGAEALGQEFLQAKQADIGGKRVNLVMTGQAVRKKAFFSVYAIAGYVEQGAKVRTAQELVDADCPKMLHLVMLRTVSGADMADALLAILRQNHPAPAFAQESRMVADLMRSGAAQSGDHILVTHIPQVGMQFERVGGEKVLIRNIAFSKAMWENYLGRYNVSEDVKRGLTSGLR